MSLKSVSTNVVLRIALNTFNKNFAVYKDNEEVLEDVSFLEFNVEDDVKLMSHPLENGAVITDHVIYNPKRCSLSVLIDDLDGSSLFEINDYYKSSTLLTIKAKGEIYSNMVIYAKPFKVSADYFDKTVYTLSLISVQEAETQYVDMTSEQVKNSEDISTLQCGQKSAVQIS